MLLHLQVKMSSSVMSVLGLYVNAVIKPFTPLTKSLLCNQTGILLWVSAVRVQGREAQATRFTITPSSAQGFLPQELTEVLPVPAGR